ncbi:putative carbohydrate esterase At4g34215 [Tasmannia lanceolata]|uniref:putative carbohydrate esterase At4g34215 n=1 Tax=Tasmannia lanceolata TaxID=3420 RepID=UPI004063D750
MCSFFFMLLVAYSGLETPENSSLADRHLLAISPESGNSGIIEKHIFLLAGQSNMAGRGGVRGDRWDGIIPPECRSDPLILRLNSALGWEEAQEPLHIDIDVGRTCGVGPGMAFANAVRANGSIMGVVGLVPCAIGGTNISQWERGTQLYRNMLRRANAASNGGIIRALLWYQGESNTVSLIDADSYKNNMEKFITDFRSDLQLPVLPVIQVALASGGRPFIEKVRTAQMGINLPNVSWVDAKGLQLEEDQLHLTTDAQVELGKMLADAFLTNYVLENKQYLLQSCGLKRHPLHQEDDLL